MCLLARSYLPVREMPYIVRKCAGASSESGHWTAGPCLPVGLVREYEARPLCCLPAPLTDARTAARVAGYLYARLWLWNCLFACTCKACVLVSKLGSYAQYPHIPPVKQLLSRMVCNKFLLKAKVRPVHIGPLLCN